MRSSSILAADCTVLRTNLAVAHRRLHLADRLVDDLRRRLNGDPGALIPASELHQWLDRFSNALKD